MAGRRRSRGRSNGPYRFTNNRRAALRRAQMISAKKRKRRAAITVGILAGGAAAAVLGAAYGPKAKDGVAKQVALFKPRMADMRNKMAARIAVDPKVKQEVQQQHALTQPPTGNRRRRHTPTATNPNPRKVTQIAPVDPQSIRDALKEDMGLNTMGGNAAKRQAERGYNDDLAQTVKDIPDSGVLKALRGKKGAKAVVEKTYRRNLGQQIKSLVEAGGTHPGRAYIDQLVAEAYVRGEIVGTPSTRRRGSNRRKRGSTASRGNSGRLTRRTLKSPGDFTEAEHQAATGMEY